MGPFEISRARRESSEPREFLGDNGGDGGYPSVAVDFNATYEEVMDSWKRQ
jgi:hypothetical protein